MVNMAALRRPSRWGAYRRCGNSLRLVVEFLFESPSYLRVFPANFDWLLRCGSNIRFVLK